MTPRNAGEATLYELLRELGYAVDVYLNADDDAGLKRAERSVLHAASAVSGSFRVVEAYAEGAGA